MEESLAAWTKRQDLLAKQSAELKRKLSTTSFEEASPQDATRLKIEDIETDKALLRHDTCYYALQAEDGKLDFESLKKLQRANTDRIVSLGEKQWEQSKALRELQEDKGLVSPITPDSERAFNAALLTIYKDTDKAVRRRYDFREDTIIKYNSTKDGNNLILWCPILQNYGIGKQRTAVHFVPHVFPRGLADFMFGPDSASRIDSTDNTLLMSSVLESHFVQHHFVLVPISDPLSSSEGKKPLAEMEACHHSG